MMTPSFVGGSMPEVMYEKPCFRSLMCGKRGDYGQESTVTLQDSRTHTVFRVGMGFPMPNRRPVPAGNRRSADDQFAVYDTICNDATVRHNLRKSGLLVLDPADIPGEIDQEERP